MALEQLRRFTIKPPTEPIDPDRLALTYNPRSDTLLIHLYGKGRPAVTVEAKDGYLAARVDAETEEVIGFQIDAYLTRAVYEYPPLLEIASSAGIEGSRIEEIRARIAPKKAKQAVVSSLLESFLGGGRGLALCGALSR